MSGKFAPLALNPGPLTVAASTVTNAVPVDVNVNERVAVPWTPTLPNPRLVVLALSVESADALVAKIPVPLRLITVVPPLEELLATVSAPAADPATAGSNCTFRAAC